MRLERGEDRTKFSSYMVGGQEILSPAEKSTSEDMEGNSQTPSPGEGAGNRSVGTAAFLNKPPCKIKSP